MLEGVANGVARASVVKAVSCGGTEAWVFEMNRDHDNGVAR